MYIGYISRAFEWTMLVYLRPFGIIMVLFRFYVPLVYVVVVLYIFSRPGILYIKSKIWQP
jgi:hypothetical protein